MQEVNTLVFEGGSVKGLAYVGALQVLDSYFKEKHHKPFLDNIQHVAGTSAGSIMALLISLKLNLDQINIVMRETSFSSFADMSCYAYYGGTAGKGAALYRNGYLCEGEEFMKWVKKLLLRYAGNDDITFAQLKETTRKDLLEVYATRLNNSEVVTFNADRTPNVSVALAIRMSMSIPVFFKPVRVTEEWKGKDCVKLVLDDKGTTYYVDGGVKANYPYQLIKENKKLEHKHIIGFKVDSNGEILNTKAAQVANEYLQPLVKKQNEISGGYGIHTIPYIFNSLMSPQDDSHRKDKVEISRTIYCWDCNVSTFDFKLDQPKVEGLLASGASAAYNFIQQVCSQDKLRDQVKSSAIPEGEVGFITKYKQDEAERLTTIVKEAGKVKLSISTDSEYKEYEQYINNLQDDMSKIRHKILIRGTAGQVEQRAANVDQIKPEEFDKAAAFALKAIQEGIYQSAYVPEGGQLKTLKQETANISMYSGFFSSLKDTRFLAEAKNILDELQRDTKYSTRAITDLGKELEEELGKYKDYRKQVDQSQVKTVIEGVEACKETIKQLTSQLQEQKSRIDVAAEKKTSSDFVPQAPAPANQ